MSHYDLDEARRFFAARTTYTTGVHELEVLLQNPSPDAIVVDVRYPNDYATAHVPGAINLPSGKWQNPRGLRKDATLYVYCYDQTCHLGAKAALEFARQGYRAIEVEGGFDRWQQKGFRSESAAAAA